jgi:hypothetical protein
MPILSKDSSIDENSVMTGKIFSIIILLFERTTKTKVDSKLNQNKFQVELIQVKKTEIKIKEI